MTTPSRAGRGQAGSLSAEVALLAPLLLLVLLLIVAAGRLVAARTEVDAAARDAARAASVARTPAAAQAAAQATLTAQGCQGVTVTTDTSAFAAGGVVTVQTACSVSLAGLTLLPLPGQQTLTSTFAHPVDTFRGIP